MTMLRTLVSGRLAAVVLSAALAASGCASTASSAEQAEGDSEFAREGAYFGLYGIKAYENFHTSDSSVHTGNSDLGIGARIGYRVTPNAAIEVIAENVAGFRVSDGKADADLDLLNLGVMGKYYFMTDRVQPYLLGGVGLASSDVNHFSYNHDGGFVRGGLGADVYLTGNFALFGEANYNRLIGGNKGLHHIDLQLGILFRF